MRPLIILIPVFNDWTALEALLRGIDRAVAGRDHTHIVVIDDGSTLARPETFHSDFARLHSVTVVRLRRNLGHQRAICVGLVYVHDTYPGATTVIMDGDGEDKPEDIDRLLKKFDAEQGRLIVFAARTRRTESLMFRVFYAMYKAAHYALTGIAVRVGNFSVVPWPALSSLIVTSEVWNHYAAAVYESRLPHESVPVPRGVRLSGKSTMNFVSLVTHGLSAISVYGDRVGVRLLILSGAMVVLIVAGVLATIAIRLFTTLAIAGWATYVTGLLLILLMQLISMSFIFAFITLNSRSRPSFLPIRDCPYFIDETTTIYSRNGI